MSLANVHISSKMDGEYLSKIIWTERIYVCYVLCLLCPIMFQDAVTTVSEAIMWTILT